LEPGDSAVFRNLYCSSHISGSQNVFSNTYHQSLKHLGQLL